MQDMGTSNRSGVALHAVMVQSLTCEYLQNWELLQLLCQMHLQLFCTCKMPNQLTFKHAYQNE